MANDSQNVLLSTLLQNTGAAPTGSSAFSPVLDPEVRKRLQLGFEMARENPEMAKRVAATAPPIPKNLPASNNPFLSSFSVSGDMLSPEDRARRQEHEIQFKELLAAQQAGLDNQQQALQNLKDAGRNDWVVPAAGFLDQTFGGNQTAVAKSWAGMSPEERAKAVQQMEQSMNQQRGQMSNQVKSLMDSNTTMRLAQIADKNARFQQGHDLRLNMAFNRSVEAATKGAFETIQSIGAVESVFNNPSGMIPVGEARAMLSNASRLLGERGVLTDNDIERVQIDTLQSQLQTLLSKITGLPDDQQVPVENYRTLINAISKSKQAMGHAVQTRLGAIGQSYLTYGARPEVVDQVINKNYMPRISGSFGVPQQGMQYETPELPKAPLPEAKPSGATPPPGLNRQQFIEWMRNNGR